MHVYTNLVFKLSKYSVTSMYNVIKYNAIKYNEIKYNTIKYKCLGVFVKAKASS